MSDQLEQTEMPRPPTASELLDEALGRPPDQRTISQQVAARLRDLIIEGKLPPGTPLRVNPLADRLGMSAMPVRDALKLLEVERLVESTPRRGAVVSALSEEDIEEIYAMRSALEGVCARHGAERATDDDIVELDQLVAKLEQALQANDLETFMRIDREFHDRIYVISGRERIRRSVGELLARSQRYAAHSYRHWGPLDRALEEHRTILEAVRARDGVLAQRLTRRHLEDSADRLLTAVRELGALPAD